MDAEPNTVEATQIRSISYDQEEILEWIQRLYCPKGFELDPTYSKGNFYGGKILSPPLKYDIEPQVEGVVQADCRKLPLPDASVRSIIFDPPFVGASIGSVEAKIGIIKQRFGFYRKVPIELWGMYKEALQEFYRLLYPEGFLIFKCQDTVEDSKQYLSHIKIINMALNLGFYPKDLFILLAKNRLTSPSQRIQQHARKYHCYFLVLQKKQVYINYSGMSNEYTSAVI